MLMTNYNKTSNLIMKDKCIFLMQPKALHKHSRRTLLFSLALLPFTDGWAVNRKGAIETGGSTPSDSILQVEALVARLLEVGLPVLQIETLEHEEPTCDPYPPPTGCWGFSIQNVNKVKGRVTLSDRTGVLFDSGEYEKSAGGMVIHVRGNTSARHEKKPFKIKLQKKADMLCRGDSRFNDKDWVLLQAPNLNVMEGFWVSRALGLAYTPSYQPVNVVLNGEFRGLYTLCESVSRNNSCRIATDADSGLIVEYDAYWWKEDTYLESSLVRQPIKYTIKYPDTDELSLNQLAGISGYLLSVESSLADGSYPSRISVPSFARWMLAQDILGNADAAGSNVFFSRYGAQTDDNLLTMPVLWDFDHIKEEYGWAPIHTYHYFKLLLESRNPAFRKAFVDKWRELGTSVFDSLVSSIRDYAASEEGAAFHRSIVLDRERWRYNYIKPLSLDEMVELDSEYFRQRGEWLCHAIDSMESALPVRGLPQERATEVTRFSLDGRVSDTTGKGIHVVRLSNGTCRKVLVR